MAREIVGFADDTTGALDVGGSFHSRGYVTSVQINGEAHPRDVGCDIRDLHSRYADVATSATKLSNALQDVPDTDNPRIFLKVDSTLRGNLLSDIDTLGSHNQGKPIFIAPAFPFYGRTCIDGLYLVKGIPISDTEFARDNAFHFRSSALHDNREDIEHVDGRVLDRGVDAVLRRVEESGKQKFTFDTRDQADLELIADAGVKIDASLVGSSGFARAYPRERQPVMSPFSVDQTLPSLFVVGSIHQTSRIQKEELENAGVPGIALLHRDIGNARRLGLAKERAQNYLDQGRTVYLATPDEVTSDPASWREIEASIGKASSITEIRHNLIVVGGETARATLHGRNITLLDIQSEYEAGIPIATQQNTSEAILTKAGGFGHANTLVDIYRFVNQ